MLGRQQMLPLMAHDEESSHWDCELPKAAWVLQPQHSHSCHAARIAFIRHCVGDLRQYEDEHETEANATSALNAAHGCCGSWYTIKPADAIPEAAGMARPSHRGFTAMPNTPLHYRDPAPLLRCMNNHPQRSQLRHPPHGPKTGP